MFSDELIISRKHSEKVQHRSANGGKCLQLYGKKKLTSFLLRKTIKSNSLLNYEKWIAFQTFQSERYNWKSKYSDGERGRVPFAIQLRNIRFAFQEPSQAHLRRNSPPVGRLCGPFSTVLRPLRPPPPPPPIIYEALSSVDRRELKCRSTIPRGGNKIGISSYSSCAINSHKDYYDPRKVHY